MSSRESDSVDSGEYADGGAPRRLRLILRELQQTNTSGSLTEAGAPSVDASSGRVPALETPDSHRDDNQTALNGTRVLGSSTHGDASSIPSQSPQPSASDRNGQTAVNGTASPVSDSEPLPSPTPIETYIIRAAYDGDELSQRAAGFLSNIEDFEGACYAATMLVGLYPDEANQRVASSGIAGSLGSGQQGDAMGDERRVPACPLAALGLSIACTCDVCRLRNVTEAIKALTYCPELKEVLRGTRERVDMSRTDTESEDEVDSARRPEG